MKPVVDKSDSYDEYNVDSNEKDPKFKAADHVRISKYKNIFAKGYTPNCSEEVLAVSKIKNTFPWTYVISDLNGEEIVGTFYEKELQRTNQKAFRIERIIKRKEKERSYMSNGKDIIIHLIVGFIKNPLYKNESIIS